METKISEIYNLLNEDINELLSDSKNHSSKIVSILLCDLKGGINTFSKPGEKLFKVEINKKIIGIGGINIDPYLNTNKRHLNVYIYLISIL